MDDDRDDSLALEDANVVGDCPNCGDAVIQHTHAGYRSSMARFAEPDEVTLTCRGCKAEWDEDQVLPRGTAPKEVTA